MNLRGLQIASRATELEMRKNIKYKRMWTCVGAGNASIACNFMSWGSQGGSSTSWVRKSIYWLYRIEAALVVLIVRCDEVV